jgi:putative transcriptional regulator
MNNNLKFFRRKKHWTQYDLAARVGVARECIDAIEKGRFLPSITLAYNIAVALEQFVLDVFPPQVPAPKLMPLPRQRVHSPVSRGISFHSGDLK